jgi:hypothetical protein
MRFAAACFACVILSSLGIGGWASTSPLGRPADFVAGSAAPGSGHEIVGEQSAARGCQRGPASRGASAPGDGGWILLGQRRIGPALGQDRVGMPLAFSFRASASGHVSSVHVYVDPRSRASGLTVALYSNSRCRPRSRLTVGSLTKLGAGSRRGHRRWGGGWRAVAVPEMSIIAGRTYWLAVLARGGVFRFRHQSSKGCLSQVSHGAYMTSLPRSWKPAGTQHGCSIAAYASGTRFSQHPPGTPGPQPVTQPPCTVTVGSAAALTVAVGSAPGGSVICIDPSGGPYGSMIWVGGAARTSAVTVRPASGTVSFTGKLTENASWVHLEDVNLGGQVWEIDGPTHDVTMENITAAKFLVYSTPAGGVSDLTIKGGSYGPNHVYPDDTIASNTTSNTNTNILIDSVLFHDQSHSVAGQHFECLQVWAANGLVIQNSKFTNCSYFDIFIQHVDQSACPLCAPTPSNITIQNDWLDCCTDYTTGSNTYYKNYAIMFPSDHGETRWSNVTIRNNSGDAPLLLGTNTTDSISYSNFRIENNALPRIDEDQGAHTNAIPPGVTADYDAWFSGSRVSPHDIAGISPTSIFANWDGGQNADGNQDFHESSGSPTAGGGDPKFFPATDIDGNTRTSRPDIGASQIARTP